MSQAGWVASAKPIPMLKRRFGELDQFTRVKKILTAEQIRSGVRQLATTLADTYGDRPITIAAILTGSLVLLADLIRELKQLDAPEATRPAIPVGAASELAVSLASGRFAPACPRLIADQLTGYSADPTAATALWLLGCTA